MMTTRERQPGTDRTLDPMSEGGLAVRLWIGQNPLLFIALCGMVGYWLGRGTGGEGRS